MRKVAEYMNEVNDTLTIYADDSVVSLSIQNDCDDRHIEFSKPELVDLIKDLVTQLAKLEY